jgi:hypothetical protein
LEKSKFLLRKDYLRKYHKKERGVEMGGLSFIGNSQKPKERNPKKN